jgi:signal transduction histidine kinase
VNITDAIFKQPKSWIWAEAVAFVLIVGYIDWKTPYAVNMFIFYAFPIFGIGWYAGKKPAVAFAMASAMVSWFANLHSHPYPLVQVYAWSVINRMVAFFFVAFCGASIRGYREASSAQVEALERTRQLEQEIVRTSEREQMRIGQDLHDGICQNLAAIDCATECLKSALESDGLTHAATARVIQKLLKETIVDARNLARGIFPVHMDADGLSAALHDLVSTTNQLRQASITFEASDNIQIKDPQTAMHLYRIVQEALSNAMRHAHASHVAVHLVRNGYSMTITIADDGCGFTPGSLSSEGMGLRTMQYRANLIGAKVRIESRPSGGALVSCSIPVPPASGIWEKFDPSKGAAKLARALARSEA